MRAKEGFKRNSSRIKSSCDEMIGGAEKMVDNNVTRDMKSASRIAGSTARVKAGHKSRSSADTHR